MPHRGKRNEPSFIPIVAQKIAELKNISLEAVQATTKNADNLFNLTERTR
jgi:TatD DNase family protein